MKSAIAVHPETERTLDSFLNKPSHAVLLTGSVGVGKTHIARELAATLFATDQISLQTNQYYKRLIAVKGTITIEQIRALIHFFQLQVPGSAVIKRIAVIEDADTMGSEAQNALLKLLEEPPAGSLLLLTSSRSPDLLSTVRSRVQHIAVSNPTPEQLQSYFQTQGHTAAVVRKLLLRHGTNVAAISLELNGTDDSSDVLLELAKEALRKTSYERLLMVDSLSKQKEQAIAFVDTLATVAMASLESAARTNTASIDRWRNLLTAAHTAQAALVRNGNTKLVLSELMLTL